MFVIRLEGVRLQRAGTLVLAHATLAVSAGELVVVTGARGAGKSSLLAVAAAGLRPQAGAVWIGERNVMDLQAASRPFVRRNIGYLPSEPPLVSDESALENVMLALAVRGAPPAEAEAAGREALERLALAPLAERAVEALSSPERRLVALARALAGAPALLVLDEPSAGLDHEDRGRVLEALGEARAAGAAVLCATSDAALALGLAEGGGREVRLEAGRLVGGAPAISLVGASGGRLVERRSL
jgi:ABC-type ATPase involved in cell division